MVNLVNQQMERVAEATQSLRPEGFVDALLDVEEAFPHQWMHSTSILYIIDRAIQSISLFLI